MGQNSVALKEDIKFAYESYTRSVLNKLNERNRTNFDCVIGLNASKIIDSRLNGHCISINIPRNAMAANADMDYVSAVKVMIGRELNHHMYDGMSISAKDALAMTTIDRIAGNYKKVVISTCIETASDIKGVQLYKGEGYSLTSDVYKEFYRLMTCDKSENERAIKEALVMGYLPATYRLKFAKTYTSFKGDDYEILDDIIKSLMYLYKRYLNIELPSDKYAGWIKEILRINNFAVRPNRK